MKKEIHYVYKITNTKPFDSRKYYIGVRTAECEDVNQDKKYMGSSEYLNEAMVSQGVECFTKEILSTWKTRELANLEEIRLHWQLDVARNPEYYNRSNATSKAFCTHGHITVYDEISNTTKSVTLEEYYNTPHLKHNMHGQVVAIDTTTGNLKTVSRDEFSKSDYLIGQTTGSCTVYDIFDGITKLIPCEEFKKNKRFVSVAKGKIVVVDKTTNKTKSVSTIEYHNDENLEHLTKGKVAVKDKKTGKSQLVTKEEYHTNENYEHHLKNKITVRDTTTGTVKSVSTEEFKNNTNLKHTTKNTVLVFDKNTKNMKRISREEFENSNTCEAPLKRLIIVIDTRDGTRKQIPREDFKKYEYYVSCRSETFEIFDYNDNLRYTCFGNLRTFCENHDLPYPAIYRSYKNNEKMYMSTRKKLPEIEKFKGWYVTKTQAKFSAVKSQG